MHSSPSPSPRKQTGPVQVERAFAELNGQRTAFANLTLTERIELVESCIEGVGETARDWVTAACSAKGIAPDDPTQAEEWMAGPIATLRYLVLLRQSLLDIKRDGTPSLPAAPYLEDDQRVHVPVVPVTGLYDPITFAGFRATVRMLEGVTLDNLSEHMATYYRTVTRAPADIALVLGAGNVTSIPPTDAFTKLFQEGQLVALKMNPVNDYLGPIIEQAFALLIDRGYLRVLYGGADVGAAAIHHTAVDTVHITGSHESHNRIVWGAGAQQAHLGTATPVLKKPITSELGNVSPWIMVPGDYSARHLAFQASNVAASVTNNASFNCVATKMLITWKGWRDRDRFLDLLQRALDATPRRAAYYPGAKERYTRFAGRSPGTGEGEALPWTLLRDIQPDVAPHLLQEESFVCVFAEVALDAISSESFLQKAVDFANERLFGTLSVALTIAPDFRHPSNQQLLQSCLHRLRYGAIGINHWPALVYALMSPPWGGYPGSSLSDPQSGIGWVHNTYMLERVEKTILEGPLTITPRPVWFGNHRRADSVARSLFQLYRAPSAAKLLPLLLNSLRA